MFIDHEYGRSDRQVLAVEIEVAYSRCRPTTASGPLELQAAKAPLESVFRRTFRADCSRRYSKREALFTLRPRTQAAGQRKGCGRTAPIGLPAICAYKTPRIRSVAFAAIMITGSLVFPDVIIDITEASTTPGHAPNGGPIGSGQRAAVDWQGVAGDERRRRTAQPDHRLRDLFGRADAT
jgi:hypothetical protein